MKEEQLLNTYEKQKLKIEELEKSLEAFKFTGRKVKEENDQLKKDLTSALKSIETLSEVIERLTKDNN